MKKMKNAQDSHQNCANGKKAKKLIKKAASVVNSIPRIGVMIPVFNRGDRYVDFIWNNFIKQTYPNKKLFVCRNNLNGYRSKEQLDKYQRASKKWQQKQAENPHLLKYWEQEDFQGLGHKRNIMLQEMIKPDHECDYIAMFDDDDVYASNYLIEMFNYFQQNPKVQLVNFGDFLGIQVLGNPVNLKNPNSHEDGALLQELEGSRAFLEVLPDQKASKSSIEQNKWHVHSRGNVLPSGFGFSFIFKSSIIRNQKLKIRFGENSLKRSGEEDVLYKGVKKHFGAESILDLPLSQSLKLAAHLENGHNISGDTFVFHFPSEHRVVVPRPLSFVPTEILQFLRSFHPSKAVKKWAATVYELRYRLPYHPTMTFVANVDQTIAFAKLWIQESNWKYPTWIRDSEWFVPPIQKPIPGGQDIPIEGTIPQYPFKISDDYSKPAFEECPQRSLVIVPRSHLEYDDKVKKQLEALQKQSLKDKSIIIPKGHGIKIGETWPNKSPEIIGYKKMARQLDLRSVCRGTSCLLIWNSKMIHQGTKSLLKGTSVEEGSFVPPLLIPSVFPMEATKAWRAHLEKEGYVVIRDILGESMDSYLRLLLSDINNVNPKAKLQSLDEVQDLNHLGLQRRGLLYTLGFPHGKFAWAIRQNSRVRDVWRDLFQTQELMGSVDVPAISCNETSFKIASKETHDEWLHWDQNALLEPVGRQKMFQSMVYLFPDETSSVGGSKWERIAMVLCMVPQAYRRSVPSEKTLLALSITGESSNHWPQIGYANYGWNGIRMEEMKEKFPHLTNQEIISRYSQRFISEQQLREKGWKRMYADLHPGLTKSELLRYVRKLNVHRDPFSTTVKQLKEILCITDYKTLKENLTLEDLREIVHPRVKDYVGFVADSGEESVTRSRISHLSS